MPAGRRPPIGAAPILNPLSLMIVAESFEAFATAIERKLVLEIC
jgi:hypothetical protein